MKAVKTEWITIIYLTTVVLLMYLIMGSSQAMKTAWLEDLLTLVPPISFLIASRYYYRSPNKEFPYGYHRSYNIAFLCGSVALFFIGIFLMVDSSLSLINQEHPSIGLITIAGYSIWQGWLMILVLIYSAIPSYILGKKKRPLAIELHNKILFTDANGQKADYQTAIAAIVGIIGIGYGIWWADSAAALFISFSVLKDGVTNTKDAVKNLMDSAPEDVEKGLKMSLIKDINKALENIHYCRETLIRLRELGQVYAGDIMVVLDEYSDLEEKIAEMSDVVYSIDWKLQDIIILPVREIRDEWKLKEN